MTKHRAITKSWMIVLTAAISPVVVCAQYSVGLDDSSPDENNYRIFTPSIPEPIFINPHTDPVPIKSYVPESSRNDIYLPPVYHYTPPSQIEYHIETRSPPPHQSYDYNQENDYLSRRYENYLEKEEIRQENEQEQFQLQREMDDMKRTLQGEQERERSRMEAEQKQQSEENQAEQYRILEEQKRIDYQRWHQDKETSPLVR